jgi:uncharacterized protein (UPF0212 family)
MASKKANGAKVSGTALANALERLRKVGLPLAARDLDTGKCICPKCSLHFTKAQYVNHYAVTHVPSV